MGSINGVEVASESKQASDSRDENGSSHKCPVLRRWVYLIHTNGRLRCVRQGIGAQGGEYRSLHGCFPEGGGDRALFRSSDIRAVRAGEMKPNTAE